MRLVYLDGMRGLFALSVVVYHLFFLFLPAAITGNPDAMHLSGPWERILAWLPQFLYNGNCGVCVFFVLSGFVLSCRFWEKRETSLLTSAALRRYLRLTLPALASVLLAYLLMKAGWMRSQEFFPVAKSLDNVGVVYHHAADVWAACMEGLWGIYFSYDVRLSYNPVLWTMAIELKGSFLSFAFLSIFGKTRRRWILYLFLAMVLWDTYYLSFVLGVALSDLACSSEARSFWQALGRKRFLTWGGLGPGILLSSYTADGRHGVFRWMHAPVLDAMQVESEAFYHILGAFFLIYAVLQEPVLQELFRKNFFAQLGRYSFAIYLVHVPVYCSLGGSVFLHFLRHGWSYGASVGLAAAASLPVIALLAWGLHHFVEKPANELAKRFERGFAASS